MMQTAEYEDGMKIVELLKAENAQAMREKREAALQRAIDRPGLIRLQQSKVGRNDPCPCGSGKKFKKCCIGQGWRKEMRVG